jgi:hypothetical protein
LNNVWQTASQEMYAQTQANGDDNDGAQSNESANAKDNVEDATFEEVK